jgi:hypothetical protein
MIKHFFCTYCCLLACCFSFSQSVGIGTTTPHSSAALDISSSNKGLLLPRFTSTQRNSISNAAKGLLVYDSTQQSYWYYTGSRWKDMSGSNLAADSNFVTGQQNPLASYNMTALPFFATDTSGYLYDSGGPGGNYVNNETTIFSINTHSLHVATDITILSMNTESPYDSLEIKDSYNNRYVFYGNSTGRIRMFGAVHFTFKSNGFNTQSGFLIRWDKILEPLTGGSYDSAQLSGWYFNTTKLYARGGVNVTNNWSPENSGRNSFAFGSGGKALGNNSAALGMSNKVISFGGMAIGTFGDTTDTGSPEFAVTGNRLFQIGNGTSIAARSNAMTVMQSGDVGIGTINPQTKFHIRGGLLLDGSTGTTPVSGSGTRLMWIPAKAALRAGYVSASQWNDINTGTFSVAFGYDTRSAGNYSSSFGYNSSADGTYSFSAGYNSTASGNFGSFAVGNSAISSGSSSASMGWETKAIGDNSVAVGARTLSKSFGSLVIGMCNDTAYSPNAATAEPLNRIFEIGNGADQFNRSNAITVLQNGNTGIGKLLPEAKLHIAGNGAANQLILENAVTASTIRLSNDGSGSGPYIGTTSNHSFSLVTDNTVRAVVNSSGTVDVKNNLTVQNGKGIIRSTDGTQKKQLAALVTVNTSFLAGETKQFAVIWPEGFAAAPDAYVGNITSGAGGWAEVVMTVAGAGTSGATLYIYNPRAATVSPNFTIKVIAIGPQ